MHVVSMSQLLQPRMKKPLQKPKLLQEGILRLGVDRSKGDSPTGCYGIAGGILLPINKITLGRERKNEGKALARLNGVSQETVNELQGAGIRIHVVGETLSDKGEVVRALTKETPADVADKHLDVASGTVKALYAEVPDELLSAVRREVAPEPTTSGQYVPINPIW